MKKQFLALLLLSASLGLMSCGGAEEPTANPSSENPTTSETSTTSTTSATEKVLESIAVSGDFTKTYYVGADEFDPVGLKVTATYSDSSTKNVTSQAVISGFDSSVANPELVMKASYTEGTITKETTFTIAIIEEPVETLVDVKLELTVSGIDSYSDFHSKMYVNSTFKAEGTDWLTNAMVQDETNPNLWTVTLEDVKPDQYYSLNFYYGNDTEPDWTYGKNQEYKDKDAAWSVLVDSEQAIAALVTLQMEATFVVPDLSKVTVDVVATPSVVATADAAEANLSEGVYVWAWNSATNTTVRFEKSDVDGLWHYELDVSVDESTGEGSLKCSFTLGTADDAVWTCHGGEWENGSWSDWNDVEKSVNRETTKVEYTVHFKSEPYIPSSDTYYLWVYVNFDGNPTYNYVGLRLGYEAKGDGTCLVNDPISWAGNFAKDAETGAYYIKYATEVTSIDNDLYFSVEVWNNGYNGNSFVAYNATTWEAFHVELTKAEASITLSASGFSAGGQCNLGTVTATDGVTVL